MSTPSPDMRAFLRAFDGLLTQVKRIADHTATGSFALAPPPVVDTDDAPSAPVVGGVLATSSFDEDTFTTPGGCIDHPLARSVGPYCLGCVIVPPADRRPPMDPVHILGAGAPASAEDADAACRVMETRTCPPSYNGPCGDRPCARFESDDPAPWLDEVVKASPPIPRSAELVEDERVLRERDARLDEQARADHQAQQGQPAAGGPRCACGDPIEWMDHPDGSGWIHSPGSDTPCIDARPAPSADEQAYRWARREPLLDLLTRLQRGRKLTEAEANTLRNLVETEMREADTARSVAAGNLRHVRHIVPELDQMQTRITRARALHASHASGSTECVRRCEQPHPDVRVCNDCGRAAPCPTAQALDGTEQTTTEGN